MSSSTSKKRNIRCCCFVPKCRSTTLTTPNKLFFRIPSGPVRKTWFKIFKSDPIFLTSNHRICEDHFNLEEDVLNWTTIGKAANEKINFVLKPNVVPSRFDCQTDNETDHFTSNKPIILRRKKTNIVKDLIDAGPSIESIQQSTEFNVPDTEEHNDFDIDTYVMKMIENPELLNDAPNERTESIDNVTSQTQSNISMFPTEQYVNIDGILYVVENIMEEPDPLKMVKEELEPDDGLVIADCEGNTKVTKAQKKAHPLSQVNKKNQSPLKPSAIKNSSNPFVVTHQPPLKRRSAIKNSSNPFVVTHQPPLKPSAIKKSSNPNVVTHKQPNSRPVLTQEQPNDLKEPLPIVKEELDPSNPDQALSDNTTSTSVPLKCQGCSKIHQEIVNISTQTGCLANQVTTLQSMVECLKVQLDKSNDTNGKIFLEVEQSNDTNGKLFREVEHMNSKLNFLYNDKISVEFIQKTLPLKSLADFQTFNKTLQRYWQYTENFKDHIKSLHVTQQHPTIQEFLDEILPAVLTSGLLHSLHSIGIDVKHTYVYEVLYDACLSFYPDTSKTDFHTSFCRSYARARRNDFPLYRELSNNGKRKSSDSTEINTVDEEASKIAMEKRPKTKLNDSCRAMDGPSKTKANASETPNNASEMIDDSSVSNDTAILFDASKSKNSVTNLKTKVSEIAPTNWETGDRFLKNIRNVVNNEKKRKWNLCDASRTMADQVNMFQNKNNSKGNKIINIQQPVDKRILGNRRRGQRMKFLLIKKCPTGLKMEQELLTRMMKFILSVTKRY
ncbi:hypothetical protein WDU94_006408 [Cyamophila willieti]